MKAILFSIAIAVTASLHAEYLYWQVTDAQVSGDFANATGARVFVSSDNGVNRTYLELGQGDADTGFDSFGYAVQAPIPGNDPLVAKIDNSAWKNDTYAFYIELINYSSSATYSANDTTTAYPSENFVGQTSEGQTYATLNQNGFAGVDLSPVNMAVWNGGTYSPVPEPTSAMLVLFGLAGLALRRRAV